MGRPKTSRTTGLGLYYRGGEIYTKTIGEGLPDELHYGDKGLRLPEAVADLVKQFARVMASNRIVVKESYRG